MAKAQAAARFMTEVAPPQVVSIMRRRNKQVPRSLDTIAEDDREQLAAYGSSDHGHQAAAAANSSGFAAAWVKRAPPTGGFMREVSKYFSDAHGSRR